MIATMSILSHVLSRLAPLLVLPALMAPVPAAARKATAARTVPPLPRATRDIIALPLNPMASVGQRLCAAKTPTGLGYSILRPASGPMPAATDFVLVNYIGYLAATGAVFDQGMRATFPVNGVIPGFAKGLQMMSKGGIARFCIPAAMGYGAQGSGPIPADADLVFQVELVDYKTAAEIEAMRGASQVEPAPRDGK